MTDGGRDLFLSPKHGGTELWLIRHGDALPGPDEVVLDGLYSSQALSDLGRRQALALAERLRVDRPHAIYSSPIRRAYQTAQPTAQAIGLEIRTDPDLREVEIGPVGPALGSDATAEQIAHALRERMHRIATVALTVGRWSAISGSEPSAALRARAAAAIARIIAGHPGQRVAVISHGGVINAYLAATLGIDRDYFFACANTSISVLRAQGEGRLLCALNDVAHLRDAGLL